MSERESHTFSIPKGYDGVSGFNGAALFSAIQQEVQQLFLDVRADVTHLFVSEPDYALLTAYFNTFNNDRAENGVVCPCLKGARHSERTDVKDEKVAQVMNLTTGTPMQFGISPKLTQGTCAVLYRSWKWKEAS